MVPPLPRFEAAVKNYAVRRAALLITAFTAVLASLLSVNSISPASAVAEGDDDRVLSIQDGYVIWGIKESWRKYIGESGTELSGGVERMESGEFKWPVREGSFDPSTNTLRLELSGEIHFSAYCDEKDVCQLDSKFKDLSLEIGPQVQEIRGTYLGRPQEDPGGDFVEYVDGSIATLDIYDVSPDLADGDTSWQKIPTTAGTDSKLYAPGLEIDPVTVWYAGTGGKPDQQERWDTPGMPVFELGASGDALPVGEALTSAPTVYQSSSENVLLSMQFPEERNKESADYRFVAIDPETLKEVGVSEASFAGESWRQTAFDPEGNSLFFLSGHEEKGVRTVTLRVATWSSLEGGFSIEDLGSVVGEKDVATWPEASGLLAWNGITSQVVWGTLLAGDGVDPKTEQKVHTFSRGEGGWIEKVGRLTLPEERTSRDNSYAANFISGDARSDKERAFFAAKDGSLYAALDSSYRNEDGSAGALPLVHFSQSGDGDWKAEYVGGTTVSTEEYGDFSYGGLVASSDGALLAYGSNVGGTIQYIDLDGSEPAQESLTPYPEKLNMFGQNVAVDYSRGLEYAHDPALQKLSVISGRKVVAELDFANPLYPNSLQVTNDGSLIAAAYDAKSGDVFLQRYDLVGITPKVVAQPDDAAVSMTQGATTGAPNLAVGVESEGETSVQWQRKLPGEKRFSNVDGATATVFSGEVSLEDNGAEFRAVISNAAGKIVSDLATVSVVSAPLFLAQPVSMSVYDGDTAVFTAPVSDKVAGEQRWERLDGDQWVAVENDDVFAVDGDALRVTASDAVNGAVFRSVLSNEVGENVSDEVTLTVLPSVVIPKEGLTITGIGFEWDGNGEMQINSPAGPPNFFSAGVSDGTEDGYSSSDGNVQIIQEINGQQSEANWENRGAFVAAGGKQFVRIGDGVAKVQQDGSAVITWQGSWSVNMYGGMVPFTFTNPVLTVNADGTGTLTADLQGYAGDMSDLTKKEPIAPVPGVTVANFQNVRVDTLNGFSVTPDYLSVAVEVDPASGATKQARTGDFWGSWPQPFVDFQFKTGLSSYWYSSGAESDVKKVANPFLIDFSAAKTPVAPVITEHPRSTSVEEGTEAVFTAAASGDPAPTVQWQQRVASAAGANVARDGDAGWEDIAGATETKLTVTGERPEETREYRAVFTNAAGTAVTDAAQLTVTAKDNSNGGNNGGSDGGSDSGSTGGSDGTANGGTGSSSDGTTTGTGSNGSGADGSGTLSRTGADESLAGLGIAALLMALLGSGMLFVKRRTVKNE